MSKKSKNKNYKYNAVAENAAKQDLRRRAEAKKQTKARAKKATKALSVIGAVLLVIGIAVCITVAIILSMPSDLCRYYSEREVAAEDAAYVEIKVQGYKNPIIVLLDKKTAPITANNFISLAEDGFYDGLTFHRIIKDFMIQGGDDSDLPAGEQADAIVGEFPSNGYEYNDLLHKRGVISMARTDDPESASSGFFICDYDSPHLDGDYAAFGYVVKGLRTVDSIINDYKKYTGYNGQISSKADQPVIEYIKVLDSYSAN